MTGYRVNFARFYSTQLPFVINTARSMTLHVSTLKSHHKARIYKKGRQAGTYIELYDKDLFLTTLSTIVILLYKNQPDTPVARIVLGSM